MTSRGQGGIRALFFLAAVFLMLLIAIQLIGVPIMENLSPVVENSQAAQDADWMPFGSPTNFMSNLRLIVYVGGPIVVFGLSVLWVAIWYIRKQSQVRA